MCLSNRTPFTIIIFTAIAVSGCGWWGTDSEQPAALASITPSDIPFSLAEPDEFRADFFVIADGVESKRFYARKGKKWKLVLFDADGPVSEIINTDVKLLTDHRRRVYAETDDNASGFEPDFIQEMTVRVLREREYTNFTDLGVEGSVRRYRATLRNRESQPSIIHYDESLKMITKQEFFVSSGEAAEAPVFIYEMRNVEFDVADALFAAPENYSKITAEAFYSVAK